MKKIAFDKTGTLTYGTPKVVLVHSALPSLSDNKLYRLCATAERYSEHPLGRAITRCCQQETGEALGEAENFQMVPGRGVSACVDGKTLLAGNAELLAEHHIAIPEEAAKAAVVQPSQGCTVTYAAVDGVFAGFLALSDTIREESAGMIDQLSALQIQPVLLTGDHQNAAAAIAAQLHIGEVHANCLRTSSPTSAPIRPPMSASQWAAWAATSPWTPRISRSSTTKSRSCRSSSRSPSA